jgi:hypothetical protein
MTAAPMGNENKHPAPEQRGAFLDLGAIVLAWLLVSMVFLIPGLQGQFPFEGIRGEMLMQWIPYRFFMQECYRSWTFPLWVPYIFGGMPFWAYSHTMSAYPLMMLSLLLPTLPGICAFYIVHVLIACLGSFRLLRAVDHDRGLALAGTVLLVGGSWPLFILSREFYLNLASWCWLPLLILHALRFTASLRVRDLLLWTAVLALQILTGDVEGIFFNLLATGLFLAVYQPGARFLLGDGRSALFGLGVGLGLALALTMIMWLPLGEYMPHNIRSQGVTFEIFSELATEVERARKLPLHPLYLVGVFFLPAEPVQWFLVFFVAYHLWRRRLAGSGAMILAALLITVYWSRVFLPLEKVLYQVPLFNLFLKRTAGLGVVIFFVQFVALAGMRDWGEDLARGRGLLAGLVMAVAGVLGFSVVLALLWKLSRPVMHVLPPLAGYLAVIALLAVSARVGQWARPAWLVGGILVFTIHYAGLIQTMERRDTDFFLSPRFEEALPLLDPSSRFLLASRLQTITPPRRIEPPALYTQMGMIYGRPEVFGWNRVPPRRYMDLLRLIDPNIIGYENGKLANWDFVFNHMNGSLLRSPALPLLDLLNVTYLLDQDIPVRHTTRYYAAWTLDPEQKKRLQPPGQWRELLVPPRPLRWPLLRERTPRLAFRLAWDKCAPAGNSLMVQVTARNGNSILARQDLVMECGEGPGHSPEAALDLGGSHLSMTGTIGEISLELALSGPARLERLRYDGLRWDDPSKPFHLLAENEEFDLFVNSEALPPAFITHAVTAAPNPEVLLGKLAAASHDELAQTAFLLEGPASAGLSKTSLSPLIVPLAKKDRVKEGLHLPGQRRFESYSDLAGVMVISQNRLPGWRVKVDGREQRLLDVDWALTGVALTPGQRLVELNYQPWAFRLGLWASLGTVLILGGMGLYFCKKI